MHACMQLRIFDYADNKATVSGDIKKVVLID